MHLAMTSFCHLCGDSSDYLTKIYSESAKRDDLERLLDQYVIPIVVSIHESYVSLFSS